MPLPFCRIFTRDLSDSEIGRSFLVELHIPSQQGLLFLKKRCRNSG